jgi:hypothetical protein
MLKHLFTCALLFCSLTFFGQYKSYVTGNFGVDFLKHERRALVARFGGGGVFQETVGLGVNAGVVKIDEVEGVYVPIALDILLFHKPQSKIFPIAMFQPGYGIYTKETIGTQTKGAFTFYAGAGIGFNAGKNLTGHVQGGYSSYGFKSPMGTVEDITGVALRFSFLYFSNK